MEKEADKLIRRMAEQNECKETRELQQSSELFKEKI